VNILAEVRQRAIVRIPDKLLLSGGFNLSHHALS
jgi:hypothetical protein